MRISLKRSFFHLSIGVFFSFCSFSNASDLTLLATNYPPFDISENNQQPGFDVEVAKAAYEAVGIEAEVKFSPWSRIMRDIKTGEAVAAVTCSGVAERRDFVYISDAISSTRVAMVTRRDYLGNKPREIEDMRNMKVITINGYATQKELIENHIPHLSVNRVKDALNVLIRRDQDVFYIGREAAQYTAKQLGVLEKLTFNIVKSGSEHPFYLCFSKKWPNSKSLVILFNKGLKIITANGDLAKIHSRYGL